MGPWLFSECSRGRNRAPAIAPITCTSLHKWVYVSWKGIWDAINQAGTWPELSSACHLWRIPMDAFMQRNIAYISPPERQDCTHTPLPSSKIFLEPQWTSLELSRFWLDSLACGHCPGSYDCIEDEEESYANREIIVFQLCKLIFTWSAHVLMHIQNQQPSAIGNNCWKSLRRCQRWSSLASLR